MWKKIQHSVISFIISQTFYICNFFCGARWHSAMSYGQENVSGIIPVPLEKTEKASRHISKFRLVKIPSIFFFKFIFLRTQASREYTQNKQENKTMGPQKVKVNSPSNFLRKSDPPKCDKKPFTYPGSKKEPLPDQKQLKYTPYSPSKDFISKNAVEVIKASPNMGVTKYVDTPCGNSAPLEPSGLVPKVF